MRNQILFFISIVSLLFIVPYWASAAENASSIVSQETRASDNSLYAVKVIYGKRRTASGTNRTYKIYIPQPSANLPGPPYPVVVLIHGFFMCSNQQRDNARFLAERGFVVFTPDISRVLWGDKNHMHNIADILDHITWLTHSDSSPVASMIDPSRLAAAGNSSGGAVIVEMLIEAQKANIPMAAICSLDGVPWDRSWNSMSKIKPAKVLAIRSESSLCNYYGRMVGYLQRLTFPYDDVKINGSHHCDAESPPAFGCKCICKNSIPQYRLLYQRLLYLYLRDNLKAPLLNPPVQTFTQVVQDLQNHRKIVATGINFASQ